MLRIKLFPLQDDICGADQWLEIFRDKHQSSTEETPSAMTSQTWLDIFREKRRAHLCHVIYELNERQRTRNDVDVASKHRKALKNNRKNNKTSKQPIQWVLFNISGTGINVTATIYWAVTLEVTFNVTLDTFLQWFLVHFLNYI